MSHSVIYAAVPPDSTFLRRVQQEEAFRTLTYVSLSARDLYGFFDSKFDFEEDLQDLIEYRGETIGAESEARLWIHKFRSELEIVRNTSPMIETRSACFESSVNSVRDHLVETITTLESANVSDLIDHLLFGSSIYGAASF